MSSKLLWEPMGVYWKYYGKVSGKEIIDASTSIYGDPRFDNLKYKLVDFLDIEAIDMDEYEVAQIAYQHKAAEISNQNIKNAIVVRSDSRELADKFCSFFDDSNWKVRVFQDMDEANVWLGRVPSF